MSDSISQEELEKFNELSNKLFKVNYANPPTYKINHLDVRLGYFFIVKNLRNMTKRQLKRLFYHIGCKQVMKISAITTAISLDSIATNDYENGSGRWKTLSEGMMK